MAIWRAYESIGITPSASMVIAALRAARLSFRSDTVREALRPLAATSPHPLARKGRAYPAFTPGKPNRAPGVSPAFTPGKPHATPTPAAPKRVRLEIPDVEFDEADEARVHGILMIEASENKTNTLAVSKVKSLRREMRMLLDEVGGPIWRYAMDESLSRARPFRYGRAIAKNTAKQAASGGQLPFSVAAAVAEEQVPEGHVMVGDRPLPLLTRKTLGLP